MMPNPSLTYQDRKDGSGFALGAVLWQDYGDGRQRVAYVSIFFASGPATFEP
jgi:hypothetical protein